MLTIIGTLTLSAIAFGLSYGLYKLECRLAR